MNKFDYNKLTPFKWFVLENFPFIEADFDAITEWQLFNKLGTEINKIINSQNTVGEQTENLTNAFIALQNYVNNYFDNLDIQEEVNNKLNEMAASGQLTEIIAQYLQVQSLLCFNTLNDLQNAENLAEGSFVKTYGNLIYNDGKGEFYKIRTLLNTDVIDNINIVSLINYPTLIAEKITTHEETQIENIANSISSHKTTSTRIYRRILENGLNNFEATEDVYYSNNQGFCMIDEETMAIGLIPTDKTNSNAKIQIINITNHTVIKEYVGDYGHVNDLSYNPDNNLLYIGGCSVYNSTGELIENDRLIVINLTSNEVNIYHLGVVIAGICYERNTKKLYTNFHNVVYELNKNDYSIINTINLVAKFPEGSVSQTVKINNNKIYSVSSFPNTINIYNMKGENINLISLEEYADNTYFIGELEDIDFLNNFLYFNGTTTINNANVNMINICKSSLIYNIKQQNIFTSVNNSGNIVVYVDNTMNNINPDGENTNKFSCLMEALMFLNSPACRKYSNQKINLANTNVIYYGCDIAVPNLRQIVSNGQNIGNLYFKGVENLTIDRATYKAVINNKPVITVENSNINFYRPSILDENNISNGKAINLYNGKIRLTNKQASDTISSNLIISIENTASTIENKTYPLNNIIKNASQSYVEKMSICTANINSANQSVNYNINSNITDILTQLSRYKYIAFVINGVNKMETIKLETDTSCRVNSFRSINSNDSNLLIFMQYFIKFLSETINVNNAKIITMSGTNVSISNENLEMTIKEIYLTDY